MHRVMRFYLWQKPFTTIEEIHNYIETKEPMDKAGAYGIQKHGAKFVTKVNGDFYTVMGMPIHKLYERLKVL